MQLNKLSISYKCNNSIGNSLNINEMVKELLQTFLEETDGIHASFSLIENNNSENIISLGKKIKYDRYILLEKSDDKKIVNYKYNEDIELLLYKLEKSLLIFAYDNTMDLEFIKLIFESLRRKINISISSCLNVEVLKQKNDKLNTLTENLQEEVNRVVALNNEKDRQMYEQMKLAQMGELIGNIAHQWRQPLSVISTVAGGLKLKKEMNVLSDDEFILYVDKLMDNSKLLSNTIDEFRDYIKESQKEKDVIIQDRVKMALKIIEPSFILDNIRICEDFMEEEPISFKLVSGELLQVIISILNNAKDALSTKDIKDKWVRYSVKKEEFKIIITIEDNAGGIPNDIKDQIFNPYFTTKHQSQGTGIGLYNCYNIVTKHLNGNLHTYNTKHGAVFCIELPKFISYSI